MQRRFTLLFLLFVVPVLCLGNNGEGPRPFERAFAAFREDPALDNASWAFVARELNSGQSLIEHNPRLALTPASVQKLVTTASALLALGQGYRFATLLEYDGSIDAEGVLQGNLYIRGSGDPSLGASKMNDSLALEKVYGRWKQALESAGIVRITGHVIADDRVFDREMVPPRWLWGHIGNYFGAGASGLSANENEYTVYFRAGDAPGAPATVVGTDPEIPGMSFVNEVITGPAGSGDQVYIYGAPYQAERRLTGSVPHGARRFPVRGSMANPPGFVADTFYAFLKKNGFGIDGNPMVLPHLPPHRTAIPGQRHVIASWLSPSLAHIVYRTNMYSVNSYAENLLKAIGHHEKGEGSLNGGLAAIREIWEQRGIDTGGLSMFDGSGLSPSNRLTATQIMQILVMMAAEPSFGAFYNSLPLAGRSGSLGNHFKNTASEGQLRAKSGTLNNVRSFAGYAPMQNGRLAAFVLIVNDYQGSPAAMRDKMFGLMGSLSESFPATGR